MREDLIRSLPETIDGGSILERLDRVLDPELDESILKLGFVESIGAVDGHVTVKLRLPTYWCAPNFSYLMAEDARRGLLTVEGVCEVAVRLEDHFFAKKIEEGVNAGLSFAEAFPGDAAENLDQLRALFLRKGYFKRQENLLRYLLHSGLSFEEIARLKVGDVEAEDGAVKRYLERRRKLGLGDSARAPLIVNLRGEPVSAEDLERYFIHARTVRVSLDANGSLCSTLLEARRKVETEKREAHHV